MLNSKELEQKTRAVRLKLRRERLAYVTAKTGISRPTLRRFRDGEGEPQEGTVISLFEFFFNKG